METIIKKAIEGGWIKSPYKFEFKEIIRNETVVIRFYMEDGNYKKSFPSDSFYSFYQIVCDPLFWQALGKSCRWQYAVTILYTGWNIDNEGNSDGSVDEARKLSQSEYYALRFHEINLTEGWYAAVSYLSSLIK